MDYATKLHIESLIEIHNNRLAVLLEQKKHFGDYTPPHIITEISKILKTVSELKGKLNGR